LSHRNWAHGSRIVGLCCSIAHAISHADFDLHPGSVGVCYPHAAESADAVDFPTPPCTGPDQGSGTVEGHTNFADVYVDALWEYQGVVYEAENTGITDVNGNYSIPGLYCGLAFTLVFKSAPGDAQIDTQYWDDSSTLSGATFLTIEANQTIDLPDVTLSADPNHTQPTPAEDIGGANPSESNCQCGHADPVNTATGEFYANDTDLALPGAGPTVGVARSYSSTSTWNSGFGNGWAASFATAEQTVQADPNGGSPLQVQVTQENGSAVQFYLNANGQYVPPARVHATLTNDPNTGNWTFTRKGTSILVFGPNGQLQSAQDLHGNTTTFGYTSGQLTTIYGSGNRYISLTWTGGNVSSVSDSGGRTVSYAYTAGELTGVTAANGAITHYGYTNGLLTTVTKPNGGVTTNAYALTVRSPRRPTRSGGSRLFPTPRMRRAW
jgi:YD repeat-containing protein